MKYYPPPHMPPPYYQPDEGLNLARSTAKGRSIHIGLNSFDSGHYGTDGYLRGCENDARAMDGVAATYGYDRTILLTQEATTANVLRNLIEASEQLNPGDTLLLTYAGHGAQIPDRNKEETDNMDETWCLYDRMLLDDELYRIWALFKPGVRILVVSDSCHSGTMLRMFRDNAKYSAFLKSLDAEVGQDVEDITYRALPLDIAAAVYGNNTDLYDSIQWSGIRGDAIAIGASVLLLAACQDNQVAADGQQNGFFTKVLLGVWDKGLFTGSYLDFIAALKARMPSTQSPNFYQVGVLNAILAKQQPFSLFPTFSTPRNMSPSTSPQFSLLPSGTDNSQDSQRCLFHLDVDRTTLDGMSAEEVRQYLQTEGCDILMKAYAAASSITIPRDAGVRGGGECHIGGSTAGGGSISGGCSIRW